MPRKHDIKKLEKKVDALSNALAKLSNKDDFRKLIEIMRKPGWTTPAEYFFVSALVDNFSTQVKALSDLKTSLLKGSKQVIAKERVKKATAGK